MFLKYIKKIIKGIMPYGIVYFYKSIKNKTNYKFQIDPNCRITGWMEPAHIAHIDRWINNRINSLEKRIEYTGKVQYYNNCLLSCNEKGISNERYVEYEVIVSLTTFDKRLYEVYLSIESIMRQTMKPNRIILWLGEELKNTDIPLTLQKQQDRGLEIRYCKDTRSYKKLIPALLAFPNDVIITIDDDLLYSFDMIENLVSAYKRNNAYIYCCRLHRMKLIGNDMLEKYAKWIWNYEHFDVSPLNFPTSGAGTLYPPHCFPDEIFNEKVYLDICKYADDVWFKAMALLNGVLSQKVYTHNKNGDDFLVNENVQDIALFHINNGKLMNDIQLKAVFDKYNLYERLIR